MRLQTERLVLRDLSAADAEALVRLNEHPNVERFTGDPPLPDVAAAIEVLDRRILPQYRDHGVGRWAVERRSDGAFLGWAGLKYLADRGEYDLGYRLMPEAWGQGYATEAAAAVLAYARTLPGARIIAQVVIANAASVRVLEKIGMVRERELDDPLGPMAIYVDPGPA